jgi:hypothetical protein
VARNSRCSIIPRGTLRAAARPRRRRIQPGRSGRSRACDDEPCRFAAVPPRIFVTDASGLFNPSLLRRRVPARREAGACLLSPSGFGRRCGPAMANAAPWPLRRYG